MISNVLQWIEDKVLDANNASRVRDAASVTPSQVLYRLSEGDIDGLRARDYLGVSVESVAEVHNKLDGMRDGARVFVGSESVDIVASEADGRADVVRVPLAMSSPMRLLTQWSRSRCYYSQRELIDILRIEFQDAGLATLLMNIRSLKFSGGNSGSSRVQQGRESMGASIEASVSGVDDKDLDETFAASVHVFDGSMSNADREPKATVRIELLISTEDRTFAIVPVAGDVARAKASARADIASYLVSQGVPMDSIILDSSFRLFGQKT